MTVLFSGITIVLELSFYANEVVFVFSFSRESEIIINFDPFFTQKMKQNSNLGFFILFHFSWSCKVQIKPLLPSPPVLR